MRVLIVIPQIYKLGGAEKISLDLAIKLNSIGVKADVLLLFKDIEGVVQKKLIMHTLSNVYSLNLEVNTSIIKLFNSVKKVYKLIKKNNYDIIETSEITSSLIVSMAFWFLKKKIPHVFGIHENYNFRTHNSFKYKIWRYILNSNSNIKYYGVSNYVAKNWTSFIKSSNKNIRVIYNCVDDLFFNKFFDKSTTRLKLNLPVDSKVVIYIGRLILFKGFHKIFYSLSTELKIHNIHILYVGAVDPENLRGINELQTLQELDKLQTVIKEKQLESYVHFLGHRNDIAEVMSAADILVHPSLHESFGLVLVEALASRLMIVASNVEGIPEILMNTSSILIDPNDLNEIKNAALYLFALDEIRKKQVLDQGLKKANSFRSLNRTVNMLNYYKEILS